MKLFNLLFGPKSNAEPSNPLPENPESADSVLQRFIAAGVRLEKVLMTEMPSVVTWSKTRKRIVSGVDSLEVTQSDGQLKVSVENNEFVSMQVRTELTREDVREINKSQGIIATTALYGKPHFRYGFIPENKNKPTNQ